MTLRSTQNTSGLPRKRFSAGEICCLEPDGRTHFKNLLFRREWPFFYSFDVLRIDGEDLTSLPLLERKRRLLRIMPTIDCRLLYLEHIEKRVCDLFRVACGRDLEGIVAKWADGTCRTDGRVTSWLKIKNREYSQMRDRHELFASRQSGERRGRARAPTSRLVDRYDGMWDRRSTSQAIASSITVAKTRTRVLDESTRLVLAAELEVADCSLCFFPKAVKKKPIWDNTSRMEESCIIVWQVASRCRLT